MTIKCNRSSLWITPWCPVRMKDTWSECRPVQRQLLPEMLQEGKRYHSPRNTFLAKLTNQSLQHDVGDWRNFRRENRGKHLQQKQTYGYFILFTCWIVDTRMVETFVPFFYERLESWRIAHHDLVCFIECEVNRIVATSEWVMARSLIWTKIHEQLTC